MTSIGQQQRPHPNPSTPPKRNDNLTTPKASNATPQKVLGGASPNNAVTGTTASRPPPTSTRPSNVVAVQRITSSKHEEFKNQLVHDVFERDNKGRVPMEKVAMLIWQFRTDPAVVQFMAQFVAKVSSHALHLSGRFLNCLSHKIGVSVVSFVDVLPFTS